MESLILSFRNDIALMYSMDNGYVLSAGAEVGERPYFSTFCTLRLDSDGVDLREVVAGLAAAGMDGIKVVIESGPGIFGDDHAQMPPGCRDDGGRRRARVRSKSLFW